MSKSSTATAQKIPTQLPTRSAWSRGPPQNTSAPTPRSQSPAPSTSSHPTHSRRPSTLGQGVPIKDGVSVPRGNVGAVKQGSAVTFGSIDDVSAPISSSPSAAPPIKSEVKSFGSVPATAGHVNGKPSISSRPPLAPSSTSSTPASAPSTAPPKPAKADILKMFQNPSSVPSSQPTSDSSSPSLRPSNLPPQSSTQSQSPQGSSSQPSHQYPQFVPGNSMRPQNSGPGGGAPRSPVYPRQMPNGAGPRPQGGPNGGPSQMPSGMSSPRLAPHPHPGQPSNMAPPPPMQPQMQPHMPVPGWPGYFYPEHYMPQYGGQWYPMPQQIPQPQHQHPPHHPPPPGPHGPPHAGMPMSPRNHPPSLPPGTPTQPHAVAAMHVPHPPPPHSHSTSNSLSGISSPPPTPSTSTMPGSARLNANSSAFVPGARSKIVVKNADGLEVDLGTMTKSSPASVTVAATASPSSSGFRQGSPGAAATPPRRPQSIRIETEEQRRKRLADGEEKEKAKVKAEAEEKVKKEKEEKKEEERKKKEEEERRKEEEEKQERARKEEEEEKERIRIQDEKERVRKEEEKQRLQEEEEERKAKEEEEKERLRLAQEQERMKMEEEERIRLQEEEASRVAAAAVEAEPRLEDSESQLLQEDGEVQDAEDEGVITTPDAGQEFKDKAKEPLRITTSPLADFKKRPGPLDLSNTKNASPSLPSALATARVIEDLGSVQYPEGISSPKVELNINAKNGKFRYDRDFLLQFMSICKEKPDMLPPLDAIGLEPTDQSSLSMSRGGSGRHRQPSGAVAPSRQASVGLGLGGFGKPGSSNFGAMGNFAPPSKLSSDERFNLSTSGRAASVSGASVPFNRPSPMQRTASQGGPGGVPVSGRTRSRRGGERNDSNKVGNIQPSHGYSHGQSNMGQSVSLEPVAPLQASANRWDRKIASSVDPDSPEIVDRKVKGLLNKLTMEKFDSISDQIIAWANKSEKEKDGRTLIQVIRLVFEKATDEATWSEMYARLCRKMMEQISPLVQDDGIKNTEGKPIAGGQLFRKYLLNRCQEDFERGWVAKEATAAAAATKALEDQAAKAANEKSKDGDNDEIVLYSEEYYAAQKAKRQGLGLIKFIGELFKLQMLTERIMHECVKKLLGNVENPEEEEIESLCKLLTTVGAILDTPKARAHMDVYFSRMKELTKSQNVSSRMQFMLQDVIELRERKWVTRNTVAAPTTIAQIHEAAAKEKAAQDKESYQRQMSMSRGGSRRGGDRGDYTQQVGPDGWAVAGNGPPRPPPKAGDLSKFGQISKSSPMTFGPGSVFAGKKEGKRESLSRTSSSSNMFSMLSQNPESNAEASSKAGAPEPLAQRKRLILAPRTKPAAEEHEAAAPAPESESSEDEAALEMTEDEAMKKIAEDSKEFFGVRNLDEAEVYFTNLPPIHHFRLVQTLASSAVEDKESEAQLVADFFNRAASKKLCIAAAFEDGLLPISESIDDIAIDAPKAFPLFAIMVKGAGLVEERRTRLASNSVDSDRLLALLS